jgi:hypothetical protein
MKKELLGWEPERGGALEAEGDLPPVVARMVVEIRSDGRRTIARGAIEDRALGETVQVRIDGATPIALARELLSSLLKTPVFAKKAISQLLAGRPRRR